MKIFFCKLRRLWFLSALGLMASCGPVNVAGMLNISESDVLNASPLELCQLYGMSRDWGDVVFQQRLSEELASRSGFSSRDWEDIRSGIIRVGQSDAAAICAVGPYERRNVTAGQYGRFVQYVLGDAGPYVYTENGKVTSWQY
jgi:hypothetical protein